MNTAIKINYYTKAAYELANSHPCPRSASDVYSLGVSFQYCIEAKYNEIDSLKRNIDKTCLADLAAKQLAIKTGIEKQAKYNLNMLLQKFYDDGGPIMEDLVTEEMAKNIQPFFNRITINFLKSLDETVNQTAIGNLSVREMDAEINHQIIELYSTLGRMFQVTEVENAFTDLIKIRQK